VEVYQRVLLAEPENATVRERIQALLRRMAGETPEASPVAEEDVQRGLRQKRIDALRGWLNRVREEPHV
jgi:hypothetical protein